MNKYLNPKNINWVSLCLALLSLVSLLDPVQNLICNSISSGGAQIYSLKKILASAFVVLFLIFILIPAVLSPVIKWKSNTLTSDEKLHAVFFGAFFIVVLIRLSFCEFSGDDLVVQTMLNQKSLCQYLVERYHIWTSRLLIEALLVGIVDVSIWAWRLFTAAFICITMEFIVSLALNEGEKRYSIIVYSLFFLIPSIMLSDAGWVSTTLNYLWPLSASIPTFLVLKKMLLNEDVSLFEKAYAALLAFFACNVEQLSLVVFSFFFLYLLFNAYKNKGKITNSFISIDWFVYGIIFISLLSIVFMLLCPGNVNRTTYEMYVNMPAFANFGVIDKLKLGVISTSSFFYCSGFAYALNFIYPIFIFSIAVVLFLKGKRKLLLLIVPTVIIMLIFNYYPLFQVHFQNIPAKNFLLFANLFIEDFSVYSPMSVKIQLITVIFLTLCILVALFFCFESRYKALIVCLIFVAGLCTRLTMGFSPTVYASGTRTFYISVICLFITIAFLIREFIETRKENTSKSLSKLCVGAICFILFLHYMLHFPIPIVPENFYKKEAAPVVIPQDVSVSITDNAKSKLPKCEERKYVTKEWNCGFHLEVVNGEIQADGCKTIKVGPQGLQMSGWTFDLDKTARYSSIYVILGDEVYAEQCNLARDDAKQAFNLPFSEIGFNFNLSANVLLNSDGSLKYDRIGFVMVGLNEDYRYEPINYGLSLN